MMDATETINMSAGDSMTLNGFSANISSNIPNVIFHLTFLMVTP